MYVGVFKQPGDRAMDAGDDYDEFGSIINEDDKFLDNEEKSSFTIQNQQIKEVSEEQKEASFLGRDKRTQVKHSFSK